MSSAQTNNAQATNRSTEHRGNGDSRGRGTAQQNDVYQPPALCDDENRLIKLDSTIAAAEAVRCLLIPILGVSGPECICKRAAKCQERASLQKRIAEKALIKSLQAGLAEVCAQGLLQHNLSLQGQQAQTNVMCRQPGRSRQLKHVQASLSRKGMMLSRLGPVSAHILPKVCLHCKGKQAYAVAVLQARQRDEIVFKDKLFASQHEVQGLNTTLAGLNSELHARSGNCFAFWLHSHAKQAIVAAADDAARGTFVMGNSVLCNGIGKMSCYSSSPKTKRWGMILTLSEYRMQSCRGLLPKR